MRPIPIGFKIMFWMLLALTLLLLASMLIISNEPDARPVADRRLRLFRVGREPSRPKERLT